MTAEDCFLRKFGKNKVLMYFLKAYKWCISFFWGIKKEMTLREKIIFSLANKFVKRGRRNVIRLEKAKCKHNLFFVSGRGNQISIGEGSEIENVEFEVQGENNCINIGKNVVLRNSLIAVADKESLISIGDDTSIGKGAKFVALESSKVEIGKGCLFSTNISIMNSDSHSIIDLKDHYRKNAASDVYVGNHVWLGENVTILKGAEIQDNVIIGNRSMLLKGKYQSNSIYAGLPAKFIRGGCRLVS